MLDVDPKHAPSAAPRSSGCRPVNAYCPYAFVLPSKSWQNTNKNTVSFWNEKGQEQPADNDRAQKADKTQPGHKRRNG
jgi:hypothetical protein